MKSARALNMHPFRVQNLRRLLIEITLILLVGTNALPSILGQEASNFPSFLGSGSCASTSCHGGAGSDQQQHLIWSRYDYHSRTYATLTAARSARIGETLGINRPAEDLRCTVCHAPFHKIPPARSAENLRAVVENVSCESCHGPASEWIRSHTRPDLTRAQKQSDGLRDLRDLYARANSCVACHQTLDPQLLRAGHPELLFELDGQTAGQPRHWREGPEYRGGKAWVVGQAVALREMAAQAVRENVSAAKVAPQLSALAWLLRRVSEIDSQLPPWPAVATNNLERLLGWSDQLALAAADMNWTDALTHKALLHLASSSIDMTDPAADQLAKARRAERLALGLDRLYKAWPSREEVKQADDDLKAIFKAVQSLPDFNPSEFRALLERFERTLKSATTVQP